VREVCPAPRCVWRSRPAGSGSSRQHAFASERATLSRPIAAPRPVRCGWYVAAAVDGGACRGLAGHCSGVGAGGGVSGTENRRLLAEARLQQDLRAAMDIVTRELRRYRPVARRCRRDLAFGSGTGDPTRPRRACRADGGQPLRTLPRHALQCRDCSSPVADAASSLRRTHAT
jgi:hypothetical protein